MKRHVALRPGGVVCVSHTSVDPLVADLVRKSPTAIKSASPRRFMAPEGLRRPLFVIERKSLTFSAVSTLLPSGILLFFFLFPLSSPTLFTIPQRR